MNRPPLPRPDRSPRPTLFLDIDGVLNSGAWYARQRTAGMLIISIHDRKQMIDPEAVKRVQRIVDATGCRVVVTSSWRITYGIEVIEEWLQEAGFVGRINARTPQLGHRGDEITAWLDANPSVFHLPYAILDDEPDLDTHEGRWLVTDDDVGITDEHVERAIAMLKAA